MTNPNFLIVGSTKSGTTSLWHYLNRDPRIFMSEKKEPHFFAFSNGVPPYQGPRDMERMNHQCVCDERAYRDLFMNSQGCTARGEASAMYLYLPQAPRAIKSFDAGMKMIAVLRNPVDRAYSAYLHHIRDGVEPLEFLEAFEADRRGERDAWMPLWHYYKMGLYSQQISLYYEHFSSEQLRVYLYEDLCERPQEMIADIQQFLELSPALAPGTTERFNISGIPRSRWLHSLLTKPSPFKSLVRRVVPRQFLFPAVQQLKSRNLRRPPAMRQQDRARLVDCYRSDIRELEYLINRDLSSWIASTASRAA